MMSSEDRICVLGMGFIGLTLATAFAEAGVQVLGVDIKPEVIDSLREKKCYFFEPGLAELIDKTVGDTLELSREIPDDRCNFYCICVGTPIDRDTGRPSLGFIESSTQSLLPVLKKGDTVVLRSTVPVGTSRDLVLKTIEAHTGMIGDRDFFFGFVPERTVEGNAVFEQRNIPQIIGALGPASQERIRSVFGKINKNLICVPQIEYAELCKIIDNSYRDVIFGYANQMALISEHLGLDFHEIRAACNRDYPRNNIPAASPGVGGYCLTKDPYILIDLCKKIGVTTELIQSARNINEYTVEHLAEKILNRLASMGKNVAASKIFIMGFAFKGSPETSDTRFSTTIDLVEHLKPACSNLHGYDHLVPSEELEAIGVATCSIEEGFSNADAVVVMNSHWTHRGLDIRRLSEAASKPLLFVDCWNLYDKYELQSIDSLSYSSVGLA